MSIKSYDSANIKSHDHMITLTSVIIICGVETTEQQIVAMELERKSRPGPIRSLFRSRAGTEDTTLFIRSRMCSKTAKLKAPWGRDKTKLAPAPHVSRRNMLGFIRSSNFGLLGPRDDCMMVFMVFAGCMTVCAMLLETAPLTMFSQKTRGRAVAATEEAAAITVLAWESVDGLVLRCGFMVCWISAASSSWSMKAFLILRDSSSTP